MNDTMIRRLATTLVDFAHGKQWTPSDPLDLFAFCHYEMRQPDNFPLVVRFDKRIGKYLVFCEGPTYGCEGRMLEAARKFGMSEVPCRILDGADHSGQAEPPSDTSAEEREEPPAITSDPRAHETVFRELYPVLAQYASSRARRARKDILRVDDQEDWLQDAMLVLWDEFCRADPPRLTDAVSVTRFVHRILRNQSARTARLARRTVPLSDECDAGRDTVEETVLFKEEVERAEGVAQDVCDLIEEANRWVDEDVSSLSGSEADAVRAWLDGAKYQVAAQVSGLSFGRVRGRVNRLKANPRLRARFREIRFEWRRLHRISPALAMEVRLGRLARLDDG